MRKTPQQPNNWFTASMTSPYCISEQILVFSIVGASICVGSEKTGTSYGHATMEIN